MLSRFIKDESGVAMGLAVIMVVLIGVMGAGLLVFVRNDLEAVVEVNQGQKAFDIADSGLQVARQRLLGHAQRELYDIDNNSDPLFYAAACNVDADTVASSWSPENNGGVERNFAGGRFTVSIRWMNPSCSKTDAKAPEATPPAGREYFKVVSTGTYGGATRKVEAIYSTYDLEVPKGYFTPNSIEVKGTADVKDVSLFSLGDVTITNGAQITGTDQAYGDWKNSVNPTARRDALGNLVTAAGVGAAGTISNKVPGRDYDKTTCPKLVKDLSEPSTCASPERIAFPFNPSREPDIEFLRDEAMRQEQDDPSTQRHYYTPSNGNFSLSNWPDNSSHDTVVFVDFSSANSNNVVKWDMSGSCTDDPPRRGTLVIRNGNFTTQPNKALFQGVVIVRGGEATDGDTADSGNTCLDGFVNASGTIKIAGRVSPFSSAALVNRPGFYGVRQWSWRELYE
jgi:hypothetical protein